jgi:hypothetical protein
MQWTSGLPLELLIKYAVNVVAFTREILKFDPDPVQEKVLALNPSRLILKCTRQWGKSTLATILALYRAMIVPGSLILVISRSGRQSANIIRKARQILVKAGIYKKVIGRKSGGLGGHDLTLAFANGSEIIALPGDAETTRSYSAVSFLIIDEAAFVPDPIYYAFRPTLAVSRGDLAILSTPCGKRGFFYNEHEYSVEKFHKVEVKASDCPRISKEFLEIEITKGEDYFAQEYDCQFVENGEYLFNADDIKKLIRSDVAAIPPPPSNITLKRPVTKL